MKIINIGRSPDNDYVINDLSVSSLHARLIVKDDGTVSIHDNGSTNGTFVNGIRIVNDTILNKNCRVRVGQVELAWTALVYGHTNGLASTIPMRDCRNGTYSGTMLSSNAGFEQSDSTQKTIGRDGSCDIRMSATDVSSRHAVLGLNDDGTVFIMDCGSKNGTYVNGKRISHKKLEHGDKLLIANKYFVDWEQVFPSTGRRGSHHGGKRTAKIVFLTLSLMALASIAGYYAWNYLRRPKALQPTEIYSMYKKSVVMIQNAYTYRVTYNDMPVTTAFDILLDEDWDLDISDNYYVDDKSLRSGVAVGYGSGFFISHDGMIMTNRHVVSELETERAKNVELIRQTVSDIIQENAMILLLNDYFDDYHILEEIAEGLEVSYETVSLGVFMNDTYVNSQSDMIPCSLYDVSQSSDIDIAIIQTNSKTTPAEVVNVVDLNDIAEQENIEIGSAIYTIGFPFAVTIGDTPIGLEANNQSGSVTQNRGLYVYGHNITIERGASGSPVFDRFGKFAGVIVSGYLGLSQGYNHAVQPLPVHEFYNSMSLH